MTNRPKKWQQHPTSNCTHSNPRYIMSGNTADDEKISMLLSMGFDASKSKRALADCNGDVQAAVNRMLLQTDDPATTTTATNGPATVVQTALSQYDIPNGRSACTCVALHIASEFLSSIAPPSYNNDPNDDPVQRLLTPSFLETKLRSGVHLYDSHSHSFHSEHLSAEEILSKFPRSAFHVQSTGGIRQGIVTPPSPPSSPHPLGFHSTLTACHHDADRTRWTAVVVTKPPESVCVLLPPAGGAGGFVLIDSHSRPQLGRDGCYAEVHGSMEGLVGSLVGLFPAVDFRGQGVGEAMAGMYNSFDVYSLQGGME